ncbi:MAG: Rieske 2Fe-2S domain-containing protein [Methylobacteriaceae bacterium]|nr:Rieske 2Fe-2S domain-containing protein [Methylobacteriaceae bacterium]
MNAPLRHDAGLRAIAALIDDRPHEQVFEVDRRIFTDPAVYEAEVKHIFEATWNFVGLETQISQPDDFVTTHIGRHPVMLTRDRDGGINCFLNTCRHRGTIVCPFKSGRRALHVCRYHGWSYDSAGRNVAIPELAAGQYPQGFERRDHDLIKVAKLGSYRGFIFASLSSDVPPLDDYLGETKRFLDLVLDQSESGEVEFVAGSSTYTFDANWKLQFENGLDYYHFAATHSSYVDILKRRPADAASKLGLPEEVDEEEGQGSFNFDHGHAVNWSIKRAQLYGRPLSYDPSVLDAARKRVGSDRAKWMLRQRNLTIFPNLQVIDILSAQVRTWRPLAANKTEMVSHCLAPVGEQPDLRAIRIRNYEDFFNPTGLASSDDNVMYEFCQSGYEADVAGNTQGYLRGAGHASAGNSRHAAELGVVPHEWSFGTLGFGGETNFHSGYREWKRLLERAATRNA